MAMAFGSGAQVLSKRSELERCGRSSHSVRHFKN